MIPVSPPIEQLSTHDLLKEWNAAVGALAAMEGSNPTWEWKLVQVQLERLHALGHELRRKKSLERAKWQP
ncbi:MAG: hypothetical protein OEW39_08845 [Deltaproteobacteria bacterium]|nr:hypothetical protein [Deltaproteobacteria bacterium]MDH4247911.1 hypothetical protein [Deltaproteobacteria bacterium]